MPKKKLKEVSSIESLRYAEYYDMQDTLDELYDKSKNGETFINLMDLILARENILLAYRSIKFNPGSDTKGTDNLTIKDIGKLEPEELVEKVRYFLIGTPHGYRPKPVRRKDIPKPNGKTRPLGIPCIWDRLIQQCIKQILEPICEAKFSKNSFGFRPERSVENAMARLYQLMQLTHLNYVVEFDIEGFFDNINHSKLIKQMWSLGIRDKTLLFVIKRILKAPIKMPNGQTMIPNKGTPQGGIISPILANIVLNELDQWVDSQWVNHPAVLKYAQIDKRDGSICKSHGYEALRKKNLKEMYIVRYADDFRILCRKKEDADKVLVATTNWLKDRLKLNVSPEKTRVVNVKKKYTEFLGFKIRLRKKRDKYTVESHMSDKAIKREARNLKEQAALVARPHNGRTEYQEITLYNLKVMGIQNYYCVATDISLDCRKIQHQMDIVFYNRLRGKKPKISRLAKEGRPLTESERKRYGNTKQMKYVKGTDEPIYPIGYVKHKKPMGKYIKENKYTKEGRATMHKPLSINMNLMYALMREKLYGESAEYADNRISRFSAQKGRCAITGIEFETLSEIHCHHIIPREYKGTDEYMNLLLVLKPIHIAIHAKNEDVVRKYLSQFKLNKEQKMRFNELRTKAHRDKIEL